MDELEIKDVSITDKVYNRIVELILINELQPGERIIPSKIAHIFKVSRTPVREALVKLEKEGFIYSVPRSGTFVSKFTVEDIKEIYEIRKVIEGLAVRFAAANPNKDFLNEMSEACKDYGRGIQQKDINSCIINDVKFHKLLIKSSNSRRLEEIQKGFQIQEVGIAKKGKNYWKYAPMYLEDHLNIVKLVSEGKEVLAEKKIKEHIEKGKMRLL